MSGDGGKQSEWGRVGHLEQGGQGHSTEMTFAKRPEEVGSVVVRVAGRGGV